MSQDPPCRSMPVSPTIEYSMRRNLLYLADGSEHRFTRRWETAVLGLLAGDGVGVAQITAGQLDIELQRRGQIKPLTRAQRQRVLTSLAAGLARIPGQPVALTWPPRKATVGPWQLHQTGRVRLLDRDGGAVPMPVAESEFWPAPLFLETESGIEVLLACLASFMTAEALAVAGNYSGAIEVLEPLTELKPLSVEGRILAFARLAQWHKAIGEFAAARQWLQRVFEAAAAGVRDPGLVTWAGFYLERIAYDEAPGSAWPHLLAKVAAPAGVGLADPRIVPEWHNLRALLLRRALRHETETMCRPRQYLAGLHRDALRHYQSALYWSVADRQWGRVQDYLANLAFHLQSVIDSGFADVAEVIACYAAIMNCAEKFEVGDHSAWVHVFLGEFWLDHEPALGAIPAERQSLWASIAADHPREEGFWLNAIRQLRECGDPRQIAIAHINWLRFARRHLPAKRQGAAKRALERLLAQQPELMRVLGDDGYADLLD